jgi:IS5 family transposase
MVSQPGFFDLDDRYAVLSKAGAPLVRLQEIVNFEAFRYRLEKALNRSDRLSFMRFLGMGPSDKAPDAKTIWLFRERLTQAGAIAKLFAVFDARLKESGYLAMSGQIIDASLVAAPRRRNTGAEKAAIRTGEVPADWQDQPAKLRHKDVDARWPVKFTKAKMKPHGAAPPVDLAIPVFG